MTRAALIAKLRAHLALKGSGFHPAIAFTNDELKRLIDDLEYCDFAHKALEGGELPQTLKKQAS